MSACQLSKNDERRVQWNKRIVLDLRDFVVAEISKFLEKLRKDEALMKNNTQDISNSHK